MAARILSVLVLACVVLWPLPARVEDAPPREGRGPSLRALSPAELVTVELLDAMKRGDAETFLSLLDLKVLHAAAEDRDDNVADYDEFATRVRQAAAGELAGGAVEEMEYDVEGDGPIVTVRVRYAKDAPWREHHVEFTGAGSETRITLKGMKTFDFGFGARGPIARTDKGGGAEWAVRAMLEAVKAKDMEGFLEFIDLRGFYEKALPQGMQQMITFEQFEAELLRSVQANADQALEHFDYKILEVNVKDDVATAKIRTKQDWGRDWEEHTIKLKNTDSVWKMTAESLMDMVVKEHN